MGDLVLDILWIAQVRLSLLVLHFVTSLDLGNLHYVLKLFPLCLSGAVSGSARGKAILDDKGERLQ